MSADDTERREPASSGLSVPPPPPRGSRASLSALEALPDRPARLQMAVAAVLLLVLVAIPLYLWRRPRAESIPVTVQEAGAEPASAPPQDDKLQIGDAHILGCHDPGPKKTAPNECDRLPDVEKALAKAIEENASCVPRDAGGGTIAYVVDVSFKRKSVTVATPRESRTMKNAKVVAGCQLAVKSKLASLPLDGEGHAHQRYRVQITATYPGGVK